MQGGSIIFCGALCLFVHIVANETQRGIGTYMYNNRTTVVQEHRLKASDARAL